MIVTAFAFGFMGFLEPGDDWILVALAAIAGAAGSCGSDKPVDKIRCD